MTKSIEAQAEEYAGKRYDKYLGTHISESWSITKANYLAGAKVRDVQWLEVVSELREALRKISDYSTLDGEKYNSYQDGWHGVADFAKRELTKADQMLREMGIK